ncbi:hypothetical protein ABW19_dt0203721 [Dactylella cylindrospora]|nr:hypothetical protein ABW19_dt0203721 [Dactylella cylindrospora]
MSANAGPTTAAPVLPPSTGPSNLTIQQAPFPPPPFTLPFQTPISFSPESSNPRSQSPITRAPPPVQPTHFRSQCGTQIHIGPLGLGTIPPESYDNTTFAQRHTPTTLQIPQRQDGDPNMYQVITPGQFQQLSQGQPVFQVKGGRMVGSSMIDTEMLSPRASHGSPASRINSGPASPESSLSRKMSISAAGSASPASVQISSSHVPTLARRDSKLPSKLDTNVPESPAVKRKASNDLMQDQSAPKSAKPNEASKDSEPDFSFLDLSLPQNIQDMFGNGFGQGMEGNLMAFGDLAGGKLTLGDGSSEAPVTLGGNTAYNLSESDLGPSSLMGGGLPSTYGTTFSKFDNFDAGSFDDIWRDFLGVDNLTGGASSESLPGAQNPQAEAGA